MSGYGPCREWRALGWATTARQLFPSITPSSSSKTIFRRWRVLRRLSIWQENARGAIPLLRRVLLLRPADQTAHAMLAAMAYKQRDCQSSVEHFGRAATVISSQALALDQYATCLAVLKRPEEAIAVLQKLVTLKPADPQVRMKLATIEFNNQRASDVIQTLRPLVESATPDPDALELVSAAYEAVGDTPRAMEALRKAI